MNFNYSQPDPAWPYAELWHKLHRNLPLRDDANDIIIYLTQTEAATPESDRFLSVALERLGWSREMIGNYIPPQGWRSID